jgi:hypothetical protein
MNKLFKTMAAIVLAVSIVPIHATTDSDEQNRIEINKQQASCVDKLVGLGGALCSGAAAVLMGKWATTTMINDHTLYPMRAQKADTLFQGWLDSLSKGSFKLINSEYWCGTQKLNVDFGPSLTTLPKESAAIEQVLNQASRIPLIGLIPADHPFFEAARIAAGNWHITIPVLCVATLIGAASVGYINEYFFKDKSKEERDNPDHSELLNDPAPEIN